MHIQLWNAFASNNSGSYTIVGSFESAEAAEAAAAALAPVLREHTEWFKGPAKETPDAPSPLRRFAKQEGVPLGEGYLDWPEYSDGPPRAVAIGHQVVLHSDYTVSMPSFFGHWFYARGGRVETELDHTHHPLAVFFTVWWSQDSGQPGTREEKADILYSLLTEPGGALHTHAKKGVRPVLKNTGGWMDPPIIGACLEDLVEGVTAVRRAVEHMGARCHVKIIESWSEEGDPLAALRRAD